LNKTVEELAAWLQGTVVGDKTRTIDDVRGLAEAGESHITFAVEPYLDKLPLVHAGAVIVKNPVEAGDNTLIIVDNPRIAFSKLLELFHPHHIEREEIHPTAVIGKNVVLGRHAAIMAYVVIGDNVTIGDHAVIYPYTFIGNNVTIGCNSVIYPGVVIHESCVLGDRVVLQAHAIIGGEGFGFATKDGKHTRIPQVGNAVIGDDVEVGSGTTIDNATLGSTTVKRGTKIDNLVHIAHNVEIGEDCFVIAQTGIAGSTKVGNHVIFAGQTGCTGHVTIGDGAVFAGKSGIIGNVPDRAVYAGSPARPHRAWLREEALIGRLPEMHKKIKELEKKIKKLEAE
jgi:UDP-3-O-[3-hydroxymyristoyl] glucosamine N-acyltransferase